MKQIYLSTDSSHLLLHRATPFMSDESPLKTFHPGVWIVSLVFMLTVHFPSYRKNSAAASQHTLNESGEEEERTC